MKNNFGPYAYWLAAIQNTGFSAFESIKIGVKHFITNGFMRSVATKHCKIRVFRKVEQKPFGKIYAPIKKEQQTMMLDFWKDNRLDQHSQMDSEELAENFKEWLLSQEEWDAMVHYYKAGQLVAQFIAEELQCAWAHDDPKQADEIYEIGYQIIWGDNGLMVAS